MIPFRTRRLLFTVLLLLQSAAGLTCHAQEQRTLSGDVRTNEPSESFSGRSKPVRGALVTFVAGSDTLRTQTSAEGHFLLKNVPEGPGEITVTHVAYKPYILKVSGDISGNLKTILLDEEIRRLEAARIVDGMPVYEFIGDTLKYNVAATQQVGDDEMLGDVMERLPGFSVRDGRMYVLDKPLEKVYLDGRLIFGDNPNNAIRFLSADQVISMKVYDELRREHRAGLVFNPEKQRVADIHTRRPILHALVAQGLASYGQNLRTAHDRTDNRYAVGAAANWFSEQTLWSANAYLNNLGRNNEISSYTRVSNIPNTYQKIGYIGGQYSRKFGSHGDEVSASYSYSDRNNWSRSSSSTRWTSSDLLDTYLGEQKQQEGVHSINLNLSVLEPYIPSADVCLRFSNSDRQAFSEVISTSQVSRTGFRQNQQERLRDWDGNFVLNDGFFLSQKNNIFFYYTLSTDFGQSDGNGVQADTLLSDLSLVKVVSTPQGNHFKGDFSSRLAWATGPGKAWSLSFLPRVQYRHEQVIHLRYRDFIDEASLQGLTSNHYSYSHTTATLQAGFQKNGSGIPDWSLNGLFGAQLVAQDNRFHLPLQENRPRNYVLPDISAGFGYTHDMSLNFNLNASWTGSVPAIEQTTRTINDSNPLYLSAGNPDLRPTQTLRGILSGFFMPGGGVSLGLRANVEWYFHQIVPITYRFPTGGSFRDYSVQPGALVNTFAHVDGAWQANINTFTRGAFATGRVSYDVNLSYEFRRTPHFLDDRLNIGLTHRPGIKTKLTGRPGKNHSLTLTLSNAWQITDNSLYRKVAYYDQTLNLLTRNKFGKHFFFNADYTFLLRTPFLGERALLQSHILNAVVGIRFLKGNRGEISLSGYDLLGDQQRFLTRVAADYVRTSLQQDMGRVWTLNFIYRFNSTQGRGGGKQAVPSRYGGRMGRNIGEEYENIPQERVY